MTKKPDILIGIEAIEYAESIGTTLNKFADPYEDGRTGIEPEEARRIASEDPGLIWIIRNKNKAAAALGRKGGKVKSPAKSAAAKANGARGGRPRKVEE